MKWLLTLCSEFSVPFPTASSDLFLGKLESVLFCLKDGALLVDEWVFPISARDRMIGSFD